MTIDEQFLLANADPGSLFVKIVRLELFALRIPFAVTFRHAGAERSETLSVWAEAEDEQGIIGYGEGCPRSYVTGEDLQSCQAFFQRVHANVVQLVRDLDGLRSVTDEFESEIDNAPACWCAIEAALLDLRCRSSRKSIEDLLGLSPIDKPFRYTAVIGDQSTEAFARQLHQYKALGFEQFKIKLSGDVARDQQKLTMLAESGLSPRQTRVDANNLWQDAATAAASLEPLKSQFHAIEEPLQARDYVGMSELADRLQRPIILDESFLRCEDFSELEDHPARWIINLRVSKMGGILRSLRVIEQARARGIRLVVGAQVGETSVLTRLGMTAASAAGELLIGHEGAFGTHLLQHDVITPPLMFGNRGELDLPATVHGKCPLTVNRPDAFLRRFNNAETP